ncbi:polysaccharide pyruvyl transferase family protein [Arthrobacter sp.]|uniref:polysaccharide pyruvyl transferase family protein n=1 Tax=Arthrobacter sp. TaxID=1667 RepID=UPI003A93C61E
MARLLLRAAKSPWVPVPAESVLAQNVIATNIGNLLFGQSMFRALSVEGTEVVPNSYNSGRRGIDDRYIQKINDEFDAFVVPLANAFRPSFRQNLQRLTRVIGQLDMPVTVVGVGSQHSLDGDDAADSELDHDVQAFMKVVLDRSASVGVRGEETSAYLKRLGFGEEHVDVIGCPSVFMNGPSPTVRALDTTLTEGSSLAMSASPETDVMVPIIQSHAQRFKRFRYIPQNSKDLNSMVWGGPASPDTSISVLSNPDSSLHLDDQIRFPLDPNTWVNYLSDFDFVVGTRIHGTVAGILSGTPTLLVAHDSRTRELADYHEIPYLPLGQLTSKTRAEDVYQYADYRKFHDRQAETFEQFTGFLEKNNLPHIYAPGQRANDFDEKLGAADLPPMVHPVLAAGEGGRREVISRLWWLRQGKIVDGERLAYAFRPEVPHSKKPEVTVRQVDARLTKEVKLLKVELAKSHEVATETRKQLAKTQKTVATQAKAIRRLDVPIPTRAKRYAKRFLKRLGRG